jgi:hypothetical protein
VIANSRQGVGRPPSEGFPTGRTARTANRHRVNRVRRLSSVWEFRRTVLLWGGLGRGRLFAKHRFRFAAEFKPRFGSLQQTSKVGAVAEDD